MRGPPLSYIPPQAHTLLKYAAPWTYERVGRYSHGYITSYKLNFSSSPLFNLLQYFLQMVSSNVPESKVFVKIFSRHSFLRTIFGWRFFASCFFDWRIGNTSTHMAFGKIVWPCVTNEILFSLQPHVYRNNSDAYTWFFCKCWMHLC